MRACEMPRPAGLWGALVLVGALAGCATAPQDAPPALAAATLPSAWQAPLPAAAGRANLADGWGRFNDSMLPPLIAAARQSSPTLASAAARIERARASRATAAAALLPRVDAVANASQGRSALGFPVVAGANLGLQAAWEIDLFGAAAAGRNAAQARLEGAQAAWHDARAAVAAETATSYVALRACEAQLVQSRLDSDSRAETSRLTGLSERAGFTAPADAALSRASAAQARSQAVSQRAACDTLLKSLVELTDIAEPELRQRLAPGTAAMPLPEPIAVATVAALPAALLQRRPDLAEAAGKVVAAASDRSQAQARERPQLSLSGNLFESAARSGGVNLTGSIWTLGPLQLTLPLFDGGARAAASSAAQASYDEAVAQYRALLRRAVREVEASLVALQASAEREGDAQAAARDFEASLRATQARQRGGLASLFDLESARRSAVAAQSALIDLRRERAAAWITLYRALGGGWSDATLSAAARP